MKIKVIPYNTLEYASLDAFPATGESGKHYLALDAMLLYTWNSVTSQYVSADFRYEGKPAYHGSYLKSGYLEFTMVASPTLIDWHIGDYIRYDRTGRIYRLYSIPQVERQAGTNHTGESFAYRNVQLYDKTKDLSLVPFRDLVPGTDEYFFSSKQDVAFTGTVENVVERLNANLEAFFGENVWNVRIADNIPESYEVTVAKDFSVSGMCIDVLNAIYETWHELGWAYVIENGVDTIIIGYPNIAPATSGNRTNVFSYDNGLTALKRNNGGLENFCTRLHVYGTERNLINRYYNGKDIHNAESVFIPNLMIPVELWGQTENKPDASKAYIEDADKIALYGLITKDIYFDGTDGRPEIYPSVEQQTIEILKAAKTSLGKTGVGAPDYYPQEEDDSIRVDQIKAAVQMPQDDGTPTNSGEKYIDSFDATINSTIVNAQSVSNRQIREVQIFEYTFVDNGVVDIRWNGALKCVLDQALADGDYISLSLCVYSGTLSRNTLVSSADFKVESNLTNGQILSLDNILSIGSKTNLVTGHYVVTLKYAVSLSNGGGRTITITKEGEVLASANIREALVSNFKIKTHQIGFDIAKMQSSGGATLSFKSGMCAGRDFSIVKAVYNSDNDDWTLTCQRSQDTSTQTYYPNASFPIAADDEFVILGITMPEEYVLAQSHRLYTLGQELFDRVSVFKPTFEPSVDSKQVLENITRYPSDPKYKLIEGKYMRLYDEELIDGDHNADVLISEITINEGEAEIATYHVVLSDRASVTGGLPRTVAKLSTEIEKVQQSQRVLAARRETTAQPGTPTFFNEGNNVNPVYFKDGMPRIIDGLDVPENIRTQKNVEAGYGVAAYGMASLAVNGGGGQGTVTAINFEGSPERIYTPSDGLITLPDYPTAASLISDGLASQNYVASYFASNFTQLNIKNTLGISDWALASAKPSYNFSEIGSKPTTLAGYGITDAHITNGVVTLGQNTITPATLNNGKIPLSQIPDAILGQLIYGGTVNGSGVVTLSQNAKDKWGITSLTLTSTNYSTYEGAFFIASADATSGVPSTLGLLVGDWVVATASGWGKIDNTDAVTGVKGSAESNYRIGNVNITPANIGLGNVENTALSTWTGTIKIVTLGTITTGVWHGSAIGYDYLASAVQTSLGKADTALQSESDPVFTASAAYGITSVKISEWNAKQNALAFDGTYDASTNKVATKSTVTNAINALDVSDISGFGAGKTLASLTETDGKIAATFQNISITKSQVSDFPTTWALSNITGADDLKAIEALTGTSGFLKKTAANTWALDTDVASGTALSGVSTRVGKLEGYFSSGVANNAAQLGGQLPSYYAVAADYTKTSDFQSFSIKVGTTTLGTYSPTSALILSLVAGSNIAFDTDATNHKLTIRNTYSYTLPMASSDSRGGIRVGNTLNIDSNGILNANIYDGLDQGYTTYALSAKQGMALKTALDTLKTGLTSKGAHNLPIYLNSNAQAVAIDALSVSGNVESTAGGVSAMGIASLAMNGGGGQGTLTQIQVNGVALADTSGVVNITATTGNAAGKIAIAGQQIPVYGLGSFAYLSSLAFTDLSSHPTTLGGYGITDAKIANGVITLGSNTITPITSLPTFYNLAFQNGNSVVDTYKPTTSPSKTIKAGSNVTISAASNVITIAATDTTYESKAAASGGTAVSLVTTGEKYTWNNKGTYSKPSGGIPATDLAESYYLASNPNGYTKTEASTTNGKIKINGTDTTVYTHPTTAGNKHIPSGGSSGQFLGYDSAGTAKWVNNPNTDTKVTQTVTTSSNTSWRPLLIGQSYSDASPFAPTTTTDTVYATHLAKFAPKDGLLAIRGLNKMNTDGTLATGSEYKVFNTNGGVSNLAAWAQADSKPSYTYSEVGAAASSHTHGNIQNGGTLQTNDVSIANGDKLVITDASDSAKVARSGITFDASTTNKALTPKGTWESFLQSNQTITLSGDVSGSGTTSISVSIGAGKVTNAMLAGSIANNKLASAGKFTIGSTAIELGTTYTAANFRSYLGLGGAATYGATSSVTDGGTSLVTSGGVYSYVNALLTAAMKIEGETTTAISDGSTTNPVVIGGQSVSAYKGMVVFYGSKEFVWVGTAWKELGDESSFALKTTTVSGTGYLTGGGALSSNQTIDIASSVKTNIDNGATAYGWGNHASAGYVKAATDDTISGLKTFSHGIFVQGRVYNGGDDEGIVIKKANNGYAGVTLIKTTISGIRTTLYLDASDKARWVYNNGTTAYNIYHPEKNGTIALTTDIPTKLSDLTDDLGSSPTHTHSQYALAANLGTASTHAHGDYVTAIGTSGNTLTWSKGGTAQTAITIGYATNANYAESAYSTPRLSSAKNADGLENAVFNANIFQYGVVTSDVAGSELRTSGVDADGQASYINIPWTNANFGGQIFVGANSGNQNDLGFRTRHGGTWGDIRIISHSGNSSVSKSGETLTVKINGTEKSLTNTNTHRPIQLNGTEILGNNTTALNLKAGTNVSLSNSNGTVTIAATDTTYSANNGVGLSGTTFYNSGVRAATINGNYLRINTNGTNADLTIPYATNANYATTAGSAPASDVYAWAKASTKPSYTLSEISSRYQSLIDWGGPNLVGSVSPLEVATIDDLGHNKFAFASAATITIQYSRDGGNTWLDYGAEDAHKRSLLTLSHWFQIGNRTGASNTVNDKLRVILNSNRAGGNIYMGLRRLLLNISTSGSGGCTVKVEHRTIANYNNNVDTWNEIGTYGLSGWSGWNSIPCAVTFGGDSSQTTQSAQVRLTFGVTSVSSTYSNLGVACIRGIGFPLWSSPSNMASTGHLYSYDISQNAAFPAGVSATSFTENGTALSSKYLGISAKAADSDKLDGNDSSYFAVKKASAGSATNPIYTDANGVFQACTYSLNKTVPSDALFTDANVKQEAVSSSSYTNWRTIPFGASNSATETFDATTVTGQLYSVNTLKFQPSSGTLRTMVFKSTASQGTAPLVVASTTAVSNLNADLLDGHHYSELVTSVGIDATNGKLTWAKGGTAQTSVNIVAAKLTTVSKTAWGRTYWTSGGVPDSISGDMSNVGNIAFQASGKNIGGTMYFDTTNHRVGINDSTPSCAFDVTGDVQASGGIAAGGILNLAYNGAGTQGTLTQIQVNGRALTDTSGIVNIPLANTTSTGDGAMSHSDKLKLDGIATGATNVNTDTVAGWGYIKNAAGIQNALGYIAARETKKSRLVTGNEYRFQTGDNDCINIWVVSAASVNLYVPYDWDYQTPLRLIIASAYSGTVTVNYKATSGTQKIYSQSATISLSTGRAALVEMIQFYNASVGGEVTFVWSTSYLQRSIT